MAQGKFCTHYADYICEKILDGDNGLLVFIGNPQKKTVVGIVYIPNDMQYVLNSIPKPPIMEYLIYHNIGKDKEFCGIQCRSYEPIKGTDKVNMVTKEYRLTDDAANCIIDLLSNHSEYKMASYLKQSREKGDILKEVTTAEMLKTTKEEYDQRTIWAFGSYLDDIRHLIRAAKEN